MHLQIFVQRHVLVMCRYINFWKSIHLCVIIYTFDVSHFMCWKNTPIYCKLNSQFENKCITYLYHLPEVILFPNVCWLTHLILSTQWWRWVCQLNGLKPMASSQLRAQKNINAMTSGGVWLEGMSRDWWKTQRNKLYAYQCSQVARPDRHLRKNARLTPVFL